MKKWYYVMFAFVLLLTACSAKAESGTISEIEAIDELQRLIDESIGEGFILPTIEDYDLSFIRVAHDDVERTMINFQMVYVLERGELHRKFRTKDQIKAIEDELQSTIIFGNYIGEEVVIIEFLKDAYRFKDTQMNESQSSEEANDEADNDGQVTVIFEDDIESGVIQLDETNVNYEYDDFFPHYTLIFDTVEGSFTFMFNLDYVSEVEAEQHVSSFIERLISQQSQ